MGVRKKHLSATIRFVAVEPHKFPCNLPEASPE